MLEDKKARSATRQHRDANCRKQNLSLGLADKGRDRSVRDRAVEERPLGVGTQTLSRSARHLGNIRRLGFRWGVYRQRLEPVATARMQKCYLGDLDLNRQ